MSETYGEPRKPFKMIDWQELIEALNEYNTQEAIATLCGVKQPSVAAWKRGKTTPSAANRRVLKQLLISVGLSEVAFLREVQPPTYHPHIVALADRLQGMSPKEIKHLTGIMQVFIQAAESAIKSAQG